ncbi:methyltransferase-like protein 27 [Protobothrops mucrosquamatus]|uniref:methyltransferase-like protein 27 n=1 Tax=Protobothrops mucrosquamatus TaxID=103944 RepID=UPI000775B9D0|nr:methyltransferase-like protein 27 [Protobothrops mucrosquamatus]
MAALSSRPLAEVQRRVTEVHHQRDLQQQLRFYNGWAKDYDQDVAVLQYQAPSLAAAFLASIFQGSPENALVLDVACGTGLVAQELQAKGFRHFHGLDGSQEMLEHAQHKGLYEDLKLCLLGQGTLPAPEGSYDATVIVGALSEGHVPSGVIPQLLLVTKPDWCAWLSSLNAMCYLNVVNLNDLEQQGLWEKVGMQEVEKWERATSHQESDQGSDYISGVVYIYRKKIKSLV